MEHYGIPNAIALPVDITNPESTDAATAEVMKRFGRIDILVNNAGIAGKAAPLTAPTALSPTTARRRSFIQGDPRCVTTTIVTSIFSVSPGHRPGLDRDGAPPRSQPWLS